VKGALYFDGKSDARGVSDEINIAQNKLLVDNRAKPAN
jgi:hypothetical protein